MASHATPHLPLARLVSRALIAIGYRFEIRGAEHIPTRGAALLVCNHVSYIDSIFVGLCTPRRVRFVMHEYWRHLPLLGWLFRRAGVILIASHRENPVRLEAAMDEIANALRHGEIVCVFPEGKLTADGEIHEFRRGVERILERTAVPVVPMALRGMWGSFFSHHGGGAFRSLPQRFRARAEIVCGPTLPGAEVDAGLLKTQVSRLRGSWA